MEAARGRRPGRRPGEGNRGFGGRRGEAAAAAAVGEAADLAAVAPAHHDALRPWWHGPGEEPGSPAAGVAHALRDSGQPGLEGGAGGVGQDEGEVERSGAAEPAGDGPGALAGGDGEDLVHTGMSEPRSASFWGASKVISLEARRWRNRWRAGVVVIASPSQFTPRTSTQRDGAAWVVGRGALLMGRGLSASVPGASTGYGPRTSWRGRGGRRPRRRG